MKRYTPQHLIEQAELLSRELAFDYVETAQSWIAFHRLSRNCYRIPFEDVLLRYLSWKERDERGEDACLGTFWEELLEEHGFESDRQWRMRQNKYLPTVRELATSGPYAPQIRLLNGKESWRGKPLAEVMHEPEFYFIDPPVPMLPAFETEEDQRERGERNRPGAGRVYVSQSEDDEAGWKKSGSGLWVRENWVEKTEWDLGGWRSTPELDRLRREMTELEYPDIGPVLEPREYATEEDVKNALERAERVLAKHKEGLKAPHPAVQRVRELAQRRHAQKAEEPQRASQLEVAQQARVDKAIEEFEKWEPPKDSRPI